MILCEWDASEGHPGQSCVQGTPTKRQVSKRQVSKRLVSKRLKRQVYKTSGLQNVRFTKRQVFKTSGCKMSGFRTSFRVNISKRPRFQRKPLTSPMVWAFIKYAINKQN
jgi:hypothetical protein